MKNGLFLLIYYYYSIFKLDIVILVYVDINF
jgi:hypothetical protein